MNSRVPIIAGIVVGIFITLVFGTALGAGVVNFLTQSPSPVFAAQDVEPDPNSGVIVVSVDRGSPAEQAGVVRGDILLAIENQEVNTINEIVSALSEFEKGEDVLLALLHGDELMTYELTMETDYFPGALGIRLCCGQDEPILGAPIRPFGNGQVIIEVIPNSSAEAAGLEQGDVILSINAVTLMPQDSLAGIIGEYEVGDELLIEIRVHDSSQTDELEVTLGEHPDDPNRAFLGVRVTPEFNQRVITGNELIPMPDLEGFKFEFQMPHFRRECEFQQFGEEFWPHQFEGDAFSGVIIREVSKDSAAEDAGLHSGDIITAIDGEPTSTLEVFRDSIFELAPGDSITLTVLRESEEIEVDVLLGEHPDQPNVAYLGIHIGSIVHFEGECLEDLPRDFRRFFRFDRWPFLPQLEPSEPGT